MRDTDSHLKNKTIWSLPRYINSVKWAGFFSSDRKNCSTVFQSARNAGPAALTLNLSPFFKNTVQYEFEYGIMNKTGFPGREKIGREAFL